MFVNRPVAGHAAVLLRSAPAVHDALLHLAAFGHRKLVFLGGPTGSWAAVERRAAVRKTARAVGLDFVVMDASAPTFEAAAGAVERVVRTAATAVIAFNDQMALGVVAGLGRLGIAVPGDLSVVGFDDVPMAAMVAPPLTTISLPTEQAGTTAVELLVDGATATTELFGELVVRESTGPVTKRRATVGANGARRPSGAARG